MKNSPRIYGWLLIATLLLALATLAATALLRNWAWLVHNPINIAATAAPALETSDSAAANIDDRYQFIQTFVPKSRYLTHVGIGMSNLRGASKDAVITLTLANDGGDLQNSQLLVSALRNDDTTIVPLATRLEPEKEYRLTIRTSGVPPHQALSLHYEPDTESYSAGRLSLANVQSGSTRELQGHIAFQIRNHATVSVMIGRTLRSPLGLGVGLCLLVLQLLWLPKVRAFLLKELTQPVTALRPTRMARREIVWAGMIGLLIAVAVTLPYYTNLHKMDSQGDVQRMLIFRALGRDSLLQDHTIARWDPYTCGGVPLLANIESAHTDPFFLLTLAFGESVGLRLSVTLTLALGFLGAFLIARQFVPATFLASLLAGSLYSFSGFQMLAFATGVFAWIPVGLVPLFIFFVLRAQSDRRSWLWASLLLAAIFLGGNPHMPVFAVMLASILMASYAILYRRWRPLLSLLMILMLTVSLSAIKFVPAMELMALLDSFDRPPSFIPPLSWAPKMFLDSGQLTTPPWQDSATGTIYRWPEFGSYIGIVPLVLVAMCWPLLRTKKQLWPWVAAGILFFLMMFGLWPWPWLREIPVLGEIVRSAPRLRSMLFLVLGLLASAALSFWAQRLVRNASLRIIMVGLIVGFVTYDVTALHAPLFADLFDLDPPAIERGDSFSRVEHGYTDEAKGFYRVNYLDYLAQRGTTDLCVPNLGYGRTVAARGRDTKNEQRPYSGEAYLQRSKATMSVPLVTATTIQVAVDAPVDDWLILNQNFFPGWRTTPPREIQSKDGLLAARITQDDSLIIFDYTPLSFRVGLGVSLLGLLLIGVLVYYSPPLYKDNFSLKHGIIDREKL